MRLFVGIEVPEEVRDKLERLLAFLRPAAHLSWSPVYNLHITTKFIGEWPEQELDKVTSALQSMPPAAPITVAIRGLGWFPSPQSPRVFWAGIDGIAPLANLAQSTEDVLEPLGIGRDKRKYSPHLTLARLRQPVPLQALHQAVARLETLEFGTVPAHRFYLYRSAPGTAGVVYTKLAEFQLAGA